MKSIAPEYPTVEVEVITKGVEIGGVSREKGWHGPVSRSGAKKLLDAQKVKMYTEEAPAEKVDNEAPAVEDTQANGAEQVETAAPVTSKAIPRTGK
jgi:hypothetical protein